MQSDRRVKKRSATLGVSGEYQARRRKRVIHISDVIMNELRQAGLCSEEGMPHLTDKGREWLRQLEELANRQVADDWTIDLIQSINTTNR